MPVDDIERLARGYGSTRPAFIRTLIGAEHHENGAMFFRTLAGLPALTGSWRDRGGGPARSVGTWAEVNIDDSYPLALLTPKHRTRFLNSSHTHLPNHGAREGRPFVEMDPVDAAARGISAGDLVDVSNDRARLVLELRVSDRLRAGVVAVPFGWWGADHGGDATADSLTNDTLTDWGGGVAYSDTLVEVARRR